MSVVVVVSNNDGKGLLQSSPQWIHHLASCRLALVHFMIDVEYSHWCAGFSREVLGMVWLWMANANYIIVGT